VQRLQTITKHLKEMQQETQLPSKRSPSSLLYPKQYGQMNQQLKMFGCYLAVKLAQMEFVVYRLKIGHIYGRR